MNKHFDRLYVYSLYLIIGTLMIVNLISLLSGTYLAIIPLVFQGAVIFAVIQEKPWAAKIVVTWAAVAIIGAIASLLAVSLGDSEATKRVYFHVSSLVAGTFFAFFAKEVFARRTTSI